MDKRIGILHLSDIHACRKNKPVIQRLVELLKVDLLAIQAQYDTEIKLVVVSGDLINSGDTAHEETEMVLDLLLQPIMETLHIDEQNIFLVAGNHEVKRSDIVPYIEAGLASTLITEDKIDEFINSIDSESIKRIEYFDRDFAGLFGGKLVFQTVLTRAYLISCDNLNIGIACVNSSWRSTGIGGSEKRKMIIGRRQIIDSIEAIKSADIKICLMHHPLDWLVDDDKTAVDRCISQFDIILNGHIHESDTKKFTTYNGQSLYNTCGKFDNSSDIFNGYALLSINPYNKDCDVILRQYFDYPRNCFDQAINLIQGGIFSASLGNKDNVLALAYNVIHSIEVEFLKYANSYFVSNVASGEIIKSFDESFIIPMFRKHSEYEKETSFESDPEAEDENITLETICNEDSNILLLGKKEIGKTTLLHYITKHCIANFNTLKKVPIIIDALLVDYSGLNVFERAAFQFFGNYCSKDDSFSLLDVEKLLESGLCTIMFDNFEVVGERELSKVNLFIRSYPSNKYIFSEKETINSSSLRKAPVVPSCDYNEVHICSLSKSQIRAITMQCLMVDDNSVLVDKVMLCFKKTALPKTPFVLSLILSLCDNSDFSPINEAVVMEQFMESLLEKSSPTEVYSKTFDFRTKEDFLIFLVTFMNKENRYFLSIEEFYNLLNIYHKDIGFSVADTKFDKLFFNKGVLVQSERNITFRYSCMIEYYLAKKAELCPEFLEYIMSNHNYLNYSNELIYYTGLNRRNLDIVNIIHADLCNYFDSQKSIFTELRNYEIGIDISFPEESFCQNLNGSRFSQQQSDVIHDTKDLSEKQLPEKIDKQVNYKDSDAFISALLIYGNCLKNLELILKTEKEKIYHNYLFGLCIMLGILKENTEQFLEESISEMENTPEKYGKEAIARAKSVAKDIIKIALPLAIQNVALENIGTSKLRSILEDTINTSSNEDFSKYFSVFLFCDLRLPGLQRILQQYVNEAHDKSLLTIIFFKILYYYQFRYFSPSLDSFLENTLAEINVKLNGGNKREKSKLIQSFKESKRIPL